MGSNATATGVKGNVPITTYKSRIHKQTANTVQEVRHYFQKFVSVIKASRWLHYQNCFFVCTRLYIIPWQGSPVKATGLRGKLLYFEQYLQLCGWNAGVQFLAKKIQKKSFQGSRYPKEQSQTLSEWKLLCWQFCNKFESSNLVNFRLFTLHLQL